MNEQANHPAIRVDNVTKQFGNVTALDSVSFAVEPGELFFLLGPSGCGKTTMLRVLAGLETPDSGTVFFGDRDVRTLPPYQRGAPMVFQNYALWPHMSVSDNIAFGLIERRVPRAEIADRVLQTLERVGLTGLGERMPGQLSGGQQQRVVLARALVLNPDVMLLDEPLSNLDAKLRAEMREEIERLHKETDISFVYVTHDQTEALSLADRLVVMHDGRIRAAGRPAELYHRPPNRFCADFLGEANLVEGRVTEVAEGMAQVETAHGTWRALYPGEDALAAGQSVTCVVRPENLRPADSNPDANRLSATMLSSRLNGATMTAVLDAGGVTMKATLLSKYATGLSEGTAAEWEADPENTIVVTED